MYILTQWDSEVVIWVWNSPLGLSLSMYSTKSMFVRTSGYEQLTACAAGASSQINQCQKNSEMKMGDLTKLRPNTQMSATYYAQFCRYDSV